MRSLRNINYVLGHEAIDEIINELPNSKDLNLIVIKLDFGKYIFNICDNIILKTQKYLIMEKLKQFLVKMGLQTNFLLEKRTELDYYYFFKVK